MDKPLEYTYPEVFNELDAKQQMAIDAGMTDVILTEGANELIRQFFMTYKVNMLDEVLHKDVIGTNTTIYGVNSLTFEDENDDDDKASIVRSNNYNHGFLVEEWRYVAKNSKYKYCIGIVALNLGGAGGHYCAYIIDISSKTIKVFDPMGKSEYLPDFVKIVTAAKSEVPKFKSYRVDNKTDILSVTQSVQLTGGFGENPPQFKDKYVSMGVKFTDDPTKVPLSYDELLSLKKGDLIYHEKYRAIEIVRVAETSARRGRNVEVEFTKFSDIGEDIIEHFTTTIGRSRRGDGVYDFGEILAKYPSEEGDIIREYGPDSQNHYCYMWSLWYLYLNFQSWRKNPSEVLHCIGKEIEARRVVPLAIIKLFIKFVIDRHQKEWKGFTIKANGKTVSHKFINDYYKANFKHIVIWDLPVDEREPPVDEGEPVDVTMNQYEMGECDLKVVGREKKFFPTTCKLIGYDGETRKLPC